MTTAHRHTVERLVAEGQRLLAFNRDTGTPNRRELLAFLADATATLDDLLPKPERP